MKIRTNKTTAKHASLWAITALAILSLVLGTALTFGSGLEKRYMPLLTNVRASIVKVNTTHTDVIITGVKSRGCFLVAASTEVLVDGRWVQGSVTFENPDGTPLQIGQQRIATGAPFVRQLRIMPSGNQIKIKIESRCHPFWISKQDIAEIDLQFFYKLPKTTNTIPQ